MAKIKIYDTILRGASRFVRWQVKKTAELCNGFSEKENSPSLPLNEN